MKYPDYMIEKETPQGAYIERIICKCCGCSLLTLAPTGQQTVEIVNGEKVISRQMVMTKTPLYDEGIITMKDGSKHITPICTHCVKEPQDLQKIYDADLKRLEKLGMDIEPFRDRKPVKMESSVGSMH